MTDANESLMYKLAAEYLRALIEDGTLTPGQAVPSVTALNTRTRWPLRTCTRALRYLNEQGVLTRYPGLGYYVTA